MPNYKEMYYELLRAQNKMICLLQKAHQKTEEMYTSPEPPVHLRVIHLEKSEEPKKE